MRRLLTRGIPVVDARALGLFRIVCAAGLLLVLREHRLEPLSDPPDGVFGSIAASAHSIAILRGVTVSAVVLFGIGLFARWALAVAAAGVFVWMGVWTLRFGSHPIAPLVVALPALLPCRWSDALSLDARLGRATPAPPSQQYGYGVWAPILVVGLACLAAAWAKVAHGPDWILNGTVKFAFVADAHRASVPWGLWIASSEPASTIVSFAAVAIEAAVITAAFSRSWVYRLAIGVAAAALFAGFYLLQGELWTGWWLLFLGFLPWERLSRPAPALIPASPVQVAVAASLVVVQLVATGARLELSPALSAYDMYSTTFPTTRAFERANPMLHYRFEAEGADGIVVDVSECFDHPVVTSRALEWGADPAALRRTLASCRERGAAGARRLRLLEDLRAFNWETAEFYWKYRDRELWSVELPL